MSKESNNSLVRQTVMVILLGLFFGFIFGFILGALVVDSF